MVVRHIETSPQRGAHRVGEPLAVRTAGGVSLGDAHDLAHLTHARLLAKVGGANAPLLGSPTLNIANPVVQFVEPEKDYVVNAKLRVVDNDGAFTEFTQPLFVRNKPPVPTITVNNAKTALPPVNNGALTSWATPNPVTGTTTALASGSVT